MTVQTYSKEFVENLIEKVERLEAALLSLECDSDWCGKSPQGTLGKRGYSDGKCQICAVQEALNKEECPHCQAHSRNAEAARIEALNKEQT